MDPIRVVYTWDRATFEAGVRQALRAPFTRVLRWLPRALGVLFAALACLAFAAGDMVAHGLFLFAFAAYLLLFRVRLNTWLYARRFHRRPDANCRVEWVITDTRLACTRTPDTRLETGWDSFMRAACTPAGWLLYPQENMFQFLPRHGFASDADYERFGALVRQYVRTVRDLR